MNRKRFGNGEVPRTEYSVPGTGWHWVLLLGSVLGLAGCSGDNQPSSGTKQESNATPAAVVDDHSGWWCAPHGIPEEVCSMCSAKAAAEFKEKGDWCEEHNRAESQCFVCDPTRAEKFAKLYEAKYGKQPPERTN